MAALLERNLGSAARCAVAALAALFLGLAVLATPAQAFESVDAPDYKSGTHYYMIDKAIPDNDIIAIVDPAGKDTFTAVKTSNAKIAKLSIFKPQVTVHLLKPGKATVTYKYKGKKYKHTYIVKKYANPAKVVKIGSKNYASKFKKMNYLALTSKKTIGKKVVLKPISGWKLKDVVVSGMKSGKDYQKHKGASFKLGKYDELLDVTFEHKKTGMTMHTYVYVAADRL